MKVAVESLQSAFYKLEEALSEMDTNVNELDQWAALLITNTAPMN